MQTLKALAVLLAIGLLVFVAWPKIVVGVLSLWPEPGPCEQAKTLRSDIEQKIQQRRVDALQDKKDELDQKLDDEIYRAQVSPEEYARYQEALQKDEGLKQLAEGAASFDAYQRAELDKEIKKASDSDATCKEKSSTR